MCSVINDVFDQKDIDLIMQLDSVQYAKSRLIDAYSFSIELTPSMQESIFNKLGLNLKSVPMKWIKGDTKPHIDNGPQSFNNTYLIYITDSYGNLLIDNISYPISKNTAFTFSEGISHETINTGDVPRLLLGPMSEDGIQVGLSVNISFEGNTTVYIRDVEGSIEYSTDSDSWYVLSFPCTVTNTDTSLGILKLIFTTNISINNTSTYFVCQSSHIQFGSRILNDDGSIPIITVNEVTNYPGFIQNGSSSNDGYNNINIFNIKVSSNNSTLYYDEGIGNGWVGQQYFGKNSSDIFIINCHSDGDIPALCGGIIGANAQSNNLLGCSSSGSIGYLAGGLIGYQPVNIICQYCWTTGDILSSGAGGITGSNSSDVLIRESYTTGLISGEGAGGIYGSNSSNFTNINCYTTGNITGNYSGGLVGSYGSNISIINCYTAGNVSNTSSGALCGLHNENPNISISSCYTYGTVTNNGYFNGVDSNNYSVSISNSYSEAQSGTPGAWNKEHVSSILTDIPVSPSIIGNIWTETTLNSPYELNRFGYSPYTIDNIIFDSYNKYILNKNHPMIGYPPRKDMDNENYTEEFDPYDKQSTLFPDLADFTSDNIVQGDKTEENRLISSYWRDLGNDVFDNWGYFYLYDVTTSKYYFPILSPQNQNDGILTTQTFNAFDRTFTIEHGWIEQGIFKLNINVNDSLPFRFGAYGEMGSDGNEVINDIIKTYTINNVNKTLYYHSDIEEDNDIERLYSYFIPKNDADNLSKPYIILYDDDDMSMYTNSITDGITIYFSKGNDVKDYVINDLKLIYGDESRINYILSPGNSTPPAIISGKSYEILEKFKITYEDEDTISTLLDDDTITINSNTGVISTTSSTPNGIYKLYIRNSGSYHITEYNLFINNIIYANGNTETIYFRYNSVLQYKINNGSYISTTLPIKIYNTNTNYRLKVLFETDITITNSDSYFVCMTDNIQFGSTSLNDSGLRQAITIDNVTDYPGLIQNGTSTSYGYNSIYVFNIIINSLNSNLIEYGGWVGQQYFGKGNDDLEIFTTNIYFVNCHTTGEVASNCGGIVGGDCGHYAYVKLLHCSSTGQIGQYSGGIVGPNSGYYATVTCEECWSEGVISNEGGGIFGKNGGNRGQAIAQRCYSEGNILYGGGGIYSTHAGASSGSATAIHCYSKGTINEAAGGITGYSTAFDSGNVTVSNCFSIGIIEENGSGIVSLIDQGTNITQTNCYYANGVWSKEDALEQLTGTPTDTILGEHYSETHDNDHFRIHGLGHSPYLQEMIQIIEGVPEIIKTHYITLTSGESSSPAIYGSDYRILSTSIVPNPSMIRPRTSTPTVSLMDSGVISSQTGITSTSTLSITMYNSGSYHISTVILTIEPASNVPICFPAGTPVLTDQGEIAIEKLNINTHTINSNPIVAISKSTPLYPYIICIKKDSLGKGLPTRRTYISKNHKVLYQEKLIESEHLPNTIKVKYSGQILYNVLLKDYSTMKVNGLTVETLHPNNSLAKIYSGKFTPHQKQKLIASLNKRNINQKKQQKKLHETHIIKSNLLQLIYK